MLNRTTFCCIVIVLFHLVGLYGFLMPSLESLFIALVPFHLLLMLILVYCAGVFLEQFKLNSRFLFSALGAMILLGLDLLIEPVAMRFDYWTWSGGNIPLQNYIGWYIVSFLLC